MSPLDSGSAVHGASRSSAHADQLEGPWAAVKVALQHDSEAQSVTLLADDIGLERGELERAKDAMHGPVRDLDRTAGTHYPGDVYGLSRKALLPVAVGDLRVRLHDDARLRSVDAGLPRPRGVDLAVGEVLIRVLAQVPHVALIVLCIPVERLLEEPATLLQDLIPNDRS